MEECTACGELQEDNWPDPKDPCGLICQECWEEACEEMYWDELLEGKTINRKFEPLEEQYE